MALLLRLSSLSLQVFARMSSRRRSSWYTSRRILGLARGLTLLVVVILSAYGDRSDVVCSSAPHLSRTVRETTWSPESLSRKVLVSAVSPKPLVDSSLVSSRGDRCLSGLSKRPATGSATRERNEARSQCGDAHKGSTKRLGDSDLTRVVDVP